MSRENNTIGGEAVVTKLASQELVGGVGDNKDYTYQILISHELYKILSNFDKFVIVISEFCTISINLWFTRDINWTKCSIGLIIVPTP